MFVMLSCSTEQAAVPEDVSRTQAEEVSPPPAPQVLEKEEAPPAPESKEEEIPFDPGNVSQDDYDTTMQDIQEMVSKLNGIVRAKDFNAWMSYLADSSIAKIGSRQFLDERANDLYKKNVSDAAVRGQDISRVRRISFRGPQDYFSYVVVPSHANDHVDEISFVSQTQVTAYTRDEKGQRLILYDLENIDGMWKIIIG